jgi:predicted N-acetyltransferase YhbS
MIDYRPYQREDARPIQDLFRAAFSASEGEKEGALIGELVRAMIETTPSSDCFGFVAEDAGRRVGAILFSRIRYPEEVEVFMLSPVAVHPNRQVEGIGKRLISVGLQVLKERGIAVVVTYGDPGFYSRVGFQPVSLDALPPPLVLSQPEGWLAQSLTGDEIPSLSHLARCVDAFKDPAYW